jgi:hypothetical protein
MADDFPINGLLTHIFNKTSRGELAFDTVEVTYEGPLGRLTSVGMVYDGFVIFKSENSALLKKYAIKLTELQEKKGIPRTTWFDDITGYSLTIYDGEKREQIRKKLLG